jgi:hypothetical protein
VKAERRGTRREKWLATGLIVILAALFALLIEWCAR